MWIFAKDGFVSIVQKEGAFMARGRNKKHLQALFPGLKVITTPAADYRFRVILDQEAFTAFMLTLSTSVDYPNFKNSVNDKSYHNALADVWGTMWRYQTRHEK